MKLHDIQRPTGKVDLLVGIHEARLFPNLVLHTIDNLLLYQSSFGSGLLLVGHHPLLNPGVVVQTYHVWGRARASYGKQVHHMLSRHTFPCTTPLVPTSEVGVVAGEVEKLQENTHIHLDLAMAPSSCPTPLIPNSEVGVVVEELGGEVVEISSP